MIAVACPICEALIELEDPVQNTTIVCPDCGEEWRLVAVDPPALVYALDMEEEIAVEADEDHPRQGPA